MTIVEAWRDADDLQAQCSRLEAKYALYESKLFGGYEPLAVVRAGQSKSFQARLERWLTNFPIDAQWDAFQCVDDIIFLGALELLELQRVSYEHHLAEWAIDTLDLKYNDENFSYSLKDFVDKVWICPVTDSLRISLFRHLNHISTPDYFPDWRSLEKFADSTVLSTYVNDEGFSGIALIEDFVGSGKQCSKALKFAATHFDTPILFMPLVIGQRGHEKIKKIVTQYEHVTYKPVLILPDNCRVVRKNLVGDDEVTIRARRLVNAYKTQTKDPNPYGFEESQGYLFVMASNCPNNSLRFIHSDTGGWTPLFPRSSRRAPK